MERRANLTSRRLVQLQDVNVKERPLLCKLYGRSQVGGALGRGPEDDFANWCELQN